MAAVRRSCGALLASVVGEREGARGRERIGLLDVLRQPGEEGCHLELEPIMIN